MYKKIYHKKVALKQLPKLIHCYFWCVQLHQACATPVSVGDMMDWSSQVCPPRPPNMPWPFQPSCLYQHDTSLGLVFPPVAARAVASHWIHRRNSPFYRERERERVGGGVEGDRHVCQSDRASLFTQQTHQWNAAVNIVPHSHADTVKKKTAVHYLLISFDRKRKKMFSYMLFQETYSLLGIK